MVSTVLISSSCILSIYPFINGKLLIIWSKFPIYCFSVIFVVNCGSLSNIILFSNLCSFYTLSLNNISNSSTKIPSIMAIKYAIFDNLLHTIRIVFFTTTNGNFLMKFTIRYIYSFFRILFAIKFSTSVFVLFFILWYKSQSFIYFSTSLVISSY